MNTKYELQPQCSKVSSEKNFICMIDVLLLHNSHSKN